MHSHEYLSKLKFQIQLSLHREKPFYMEEYGVPEVLFYPSGNN